MMSRTSVKKEELMQELHIGESPGYVWGTDNPVLYREQRGRVSEKKEAGKSQTM